MTRIVIVIGATAVGLLGLPGCGGGDGGSPGKVNYSVDNSKQVGQLTEAEAGVMCEQTMKAMEGAISKSDTCTLTGLLTAAFAGGDKAVCQEAYEECMNKPEEPEDEDDCKLDDEDSKLTDCTATVGEFEACINDTIAATSEAYEGLSCDTDVETLDSMGDNLEPASCKAIEKKCPGLAEEDEEVPQS